MHLLIFQFLSKSSVIIFLFIISNLVNSMSDVLLEHGECIKIKSLYKCETSSFVSKNQDNAVSICIYA